MRKLQRKAKDKKLQQTFFSPQKFLNSNWWLIIKSRFFYEAKERGEGNAWIIRKSLWPTYGQMGSFDRHLEIALGRKEIARWLLDNFI